MDDLIAGTRLRMQWPEKSLSLSVFSLSTNGGPRDVLHIVRQGQTLFVAKLSRRQLGSHGSKHGSCHESQLVLHWSSRDSCNSVAMA